MNFLFRLLTCGSILAALILTVASARAATFGWSGSGSGPGSGAGSAWLTPGNWTNNGALPTTNDLVLFGAAGSSANIGINFNGINATNTFVGTILLGTGSTVDRNIGNSSTTAGGTLSLVGLDGILLSNLVSGRTLTIAQSNGGGTIAMTLAFPSNGIIEAVTGATNTITATNTGVGNITKTGGGALNINTPSTRTGKTIVLGGTLAIADENRLGNNPAASSADTLTLNGGTLLITAAVTIDDANRGITIGAGNGTFNNNGQTLTISRPITGPGHVTNTGSGTVIFGVANTYAGRTVLRGGVTRVVNGNGFGPLPGAYVADQIIMDGGGILNQDSEFTLEPNRGITLGAGGGRLQSGFGRPWAVNSIITGSGTLTIANDATPNLVYLNANNTFTNDLIINNTTAGNAALVAINGSIGAGSRVRVTTNGWLLGHGVVNRDVMATNGAIIGSGGLFAPGQLTINGDVFLTNAVLSFDLASVTTIDPAVNDLLQINGDLNLSGAVIVRPNALRGLLAGTYRLINYTGALTGSAANLVADADGYTVTFDTSTAGQVNMTVTGTATTLIWKGTNGPLNAPTWDVGVTPNWHNAGSPDVFLQGRHVHFDNSGYYSAGGIVAPITLFGQNNAWGSVVPGSVTVDTTNNVTITAPGGSVGKLSGGMSLTKSGSGILTLASGNGNFPNDYSGATTVEEGILRPGYTRAFGATNGPTIATNTGSIDVNGQSLGAEPFVASGAGVNGQGAILNFGGGQNNALRYLTLAGDTTVGGVGRWDVRNYGNNNNWPTAFTLGNGYSLIKTGANQISFVDVGDTDLGNITVEQGTLSFEGNARLGRNTGTALVKNGATLFHFASSVTHTKPVALEGGARIFKDNGNLTYTGPVTLLGGTSALDVANNAGNNFAMNGQVTGAGGLQKNGAGVLQLAGTNDYAGNTVVSAGTLDIRPTGSISNSPVIDVRGGAVLQVNSRPAGLSLANGQTLTGAGSVLGALTADAGTSIAPGTSPGTLTVSSNLTLNGASLTYELNTATTEGGGVNDLIAARDLTLAGVSTVNIVPLTPLSAGPYTLFRYTNSLTGGGANLNVVSGSRFSFAVDTSAANLVRITPTGAAANLVWVGGEPGSEDVWDLNTTSNWFNGSGPDGFFQGDAVTFDDSAITNNVSLVGTLSPGNISVNSAIDYTLGGPGQIKTLSQLGKLGPGRLTLAGNNPELNGGITIGAGTLQIGSGGTSGSIGASAPITNNSTLVYNRSDSNALPNVIRGSGALTKEGTGVLALSGANTFTGPVTVNGGTLRVANAGAFGSTVGITVNNGGQVDLAGVSPTVRSNNYFIAGSGPDGRGALINSGNSVSGNSGITNLFLIGDATIGTFGPDASAFGRFDIGSGANPLTSLLDANNFALTKAGPGSLNIRVVATNFPLLVVSNGVVYGENVDFNLASNIVVYAGGQIGMFGTYRTNSSALTLNAGATVVNVGGNGTNVWTGPVTNLGPVTMNVTGLSGNGNIQFLNNLYGSDLINVIGGNNRAVELRANNDASFSGRWVIAGATILRTVNDSTAGTGAITNFGTVEWFNTNAATFAQAIAGQGAWRHTFGAGPATFSGLFQQGTIALQNGAPENPVTFDGTANVQAANINVGITNFGPALGSAALNIQPGALVTVGNFFLGDQNTQTGTVVQAGGTVVITNQFRLAHWPNTISTYTLDGGSLTMALDPAVTPVTTGATEPAGGFYIGIDGIGILTQNGGAFTTPNLVIDNRGATTLSGNTNTYTLNGGTLVIGRWGIQSPQQTYQINLGGGTVGASTSWTSGLRMTLTGVNGYTTIDPGANTITLNGPLSGTGGLLKDGPGALLLNGTNSFAGELTVNAGTLGGNGIIMSSVLVAGTLAPGTSVGVLTVSNDVLLSGTTLMEVSRSGATLTNDRLRGIAGTLSFDGALVVTNIAQALVGGEVFDLFDWAAVSGEFTSVVLPPLAAHLSWDTSSLYVDGTIKVVGPPTIALAPVSQTAYVGDNVRFSGVATGLGPITLQWQKDSVDIPDATNATLVLTNVQLGDAGTYTFAASNSYGGSLVSATLTVLEVTNIADGLLAYWKLDVTDGISTPDATTNGNHLFLTNMDAGNVVVGIRSNAFTFNGTDELLTRSYTNNAPVIAYQYPGYTVAAWVKGPVQSDRRVFSQSSTNNNNPLLNVGTHNGGANGAVDVFIRTDGNTALINHEKTALMAFDTNNWRHVVLVDNNGAVTVYVDGTASFTTNYPRGTLTLNTMTIGGIQRAAAAAWFNGQIDDMMLWRRALDSNEVAQVKNNALEGPPVITQQPVSQSVNCGEAATFTVVATSIDVIRYQWFQGASAIGGATNVSLVYTAGVGGNFSVVLSNVAGAVTSAVAVLTVTNAPLLISPAGPLAVGVESNGCGDLVLAGGAAYRWELGDAAAGAGSGWDVLYVAGQIDVEATAGNPFVVNLVSVNGGALGPAANWNNNVTDLFSIATASGGVGGVANNRFSLDDSLFANDLAGGVFSVGFATSLDNPPEASIFVRFTPNQAPVANSVTNNRAPGASLKISIADLLASATGDSDGDARALVSVGASTNGASVTTNGTFIFYSNPNSVEDEFTYTVRDVRSYRPGDTVRTATGTVRITVNAPAGTNQNFTAFSVVEGRPTMRFAGIPGYRYEVQRTPDLGTPTWTTLHRTNAPPLGLFDFVDENPPAGEAYYRAIHQP